MITIEQRTLYFGHTGPRGHVSGPQLKSSNCITVIRFIISTGFPLDGLAVYDQGCKIDFSSSNNKKCVAKVNDAELINAKAIFYLIRFSMQDCRFQVETKIARVGKKTPNHKTRQKIIKYPN